MENLFRGAVDDRGNHQRFVAPGIDWAVIAEQPGPCWAGLSARDVLIAREPVVSSAMNVLRGTIASVEERGSTVLVAMVGDDGSGTVVNLRAAVTRATRQGMGLEPGQEVFFVFKAASVRLFDS